MKRCVDCDTLYPTRQKSCPSCNSTRASETDESNPTQKHGWSKVPTAAIREPQDTPVAIAAEKPSVWERTPTSPGLEAISASDDDSFGSLADVLGEVESGIDDVFDTLSNVPGLAAHAQPAERETERLEEPKTEKGPLALHVDEAPESQAITVQPSSDIRDIARQKQRQDATQVPDANVDAKEKPPGIDDKAPGRKEAKKKSGSVEKDESQEWVLGEAPDHTGDFDLSAIDAAPSTTGVSWTSVSRSVPTDEKIKKRSILRPLVVFTGVASGGCLAAAAGLELAESGLSEPAMAAIVVGVLVVLFALIGFRDAVLAILSGLLTLGIVVYLWMGHPISDQESIQLMAMISAHGLLLWFGLALAWFTAEAHRR